LVAEFRSGGLGHHAFCRLKGIVTSTLDRWLREFEETSAFVPVRIEPTRVTPPEERIVTVASARIVGPRGAVLEFTSGADAAWVAEICGRLM
jgi:transposase-like protein